MFLTFLKTFFLLFFFLLLLMCCSVCQSAFVEGGAGMPENPIVLFKPKTEFKKNSEREETENGFKSFIFPSLGYVKDVLVVFAQAKKDGKDGCDVVEGYFKVVNNDKLIDGFVDDTSQTIKTRRVITQNAGKHCFGGPTAVFNNTHIFVFFNSSDTDGNNFKYEVIGCQNVDNKNGIKWENPSADLIKEIKTITQETDETISVATGGSGIAKTNGLIVPVWYTKSKDNFISVIINASKLEPPKWNLVLIGSSVEGKYPAVVEWGEKLIMMVSSSDGIQKVYECSYTKTIWKEALWSLSGVWGNTKERKLKQYGSKNGFISAEIEIKTVKSNKKKVMLLTHPVAQPVIEPVTQAKTLTESDYKLHLWMTDNQRVFDVGALSDKIEHDTSSTLLFANKNLFVAYETGNKEQSTINVMHLKDQVATIKSVLDTWSKQDKDLSKSCFAVDGTIATNECTDNTVPTNGLVGFLSDNSENKTHWNDKYLCVNARLTEGKGPAGIEPVTEGLKFSGAGATWPVGAQGQNQQYHFVNHAFTLVATVKIDGDTIGDTNSILGFNFGEEGSKKTFGLWCTKKGEWKIGEKEDAQKTTEENCEKNKTYQVVLTSSEKKISAYIDGKNIKGLSQNFVVSDEPLNITYFYFGAETNEKNSHPVPESHVTVRNVLLYNKQFTEEEIKKLLPKKIVETNTRAHSGSDNNNQKTSKETTDKTGTQPDTSVTQTTTEDKQSSSPPPTTEDSAVRVGVVGVLCVMLFGVFTLLGRYVY